MLLFALIGSGMSHSVLDSLVNFSVLPVSVPTRSLLSALHLYKLGMGTLYFLF